MDGFDQGNEEIRLKLCFWGFGCRLGYGREAEHEVIIFFIHLTRGASENCFGRLMSVRYLRCQFHCDEVHLFGLYGCRSLFSVI